MAVRRCFLGRRMGCALALLLGAELGAFAGDGQWTLIGWNNLGMHCMDDDYSVFTILPPYNTIDAQLIDAQGLLVKTPAGLTLTYEAVADLDGSINRTSAGKSNFWTFAPLGYGATLAVDTGLAGTSMPGSANSPQPLSFNASLNWFEGLGVPIIPIDDSGRRNSYPMMRLSARDTAGRLLATTDVVLPVSSEMDCRACHGSGSGPDAQPAAGWVFDPTPSRDYRLNILRLHDEKQAGNSVYVTALAANGFRADGLYPTVQIAGTPILCAKCHASEALGTPGAPGVDSLTRATHTRHANVRSPGNGLPLDSIANRAACYQCHPGSTTRCLRGAMGAAVATDGSLAMQCQSCHGSMSQVGAANRTGWLDEPNCQQCHTGSATQNNGQVRYTSAFETNGTPRVAVNSLFATNANTPAPGKSLYRFSKGHGGLQCSACHGSTHAEFPASHRNDNVQSVQRQGHVGALMDCLACHATVPNTINGGPHGMHPISASWTTDHGDAAESVGLAQCQSCHGSDYRGTVLSRAGGTRSFSTKFGTKNFYRGYQVSCYVCHAGPNSSNPSNHVPPTVTGGSLAVPAGQSAALALAISGSGALPRVLRQPAHGTVALNGTIATYFAEPGFTGFDNFEFTARDSGNYVDATQSATISVTVGAVANGFDFDGDGVPDLLEYALGWSADFPAAPGALAPKTEVIAGQPYLTLSLARFLPPGDASVHVEVSGDLQSWLPATILTDNPSLLKVRDNVPMNSGLHRFLRVRASRP